MNAYFNVYIFSYIIEFDPIFFMKLVKINIYYAMHTYCGLITLNTLIPIIIPITFYISGMCILKLTLDDRLFSSPVRGVRYYSSLTMSVSFFVIGTFIFGVVLTQSLWEDFTTKIHN